MHRLCENLLKPTQKIRIVAKKKVKFDSEEVGRGYLIPLE